MKANDSSKTLVFLGPTISITEARGLLQATYLPPVSQGDVVSAVKTRRPDRILIIDGYFGQQLSVWHKEILWAIKEGVAVYGASSMGALRAAELSSFGMIGLGDIFSKYLSGDILDDDEVALTFGPKDLGYPLISIPMVNLRATVAQLQTSDQISASDGALILREAKAIFYSDRTPETLRAALTPHFSHDHLDELLLRLKAGWVDQKKLDAALALNFLASNPQAPSAPDFDLNFTSSLEVLIEQDTPVHSRTGSVRSRSLAKYVALTHEDFQEINLNGALQVAALDLADFLGLSLSEHMISREEERIRLSLGLTSTSQFVAWCAENDLSSHEFSQMASRRATCRQVQRWVFDRLGRRENTAVLLDQLRLRGEYAQFKLKAIEQEAREYRAPNTENSVSDANFFFRKHLLGSKWDIDCDLEVWRAEACFRDIDELEDAVKELLSDADYLDSSARKWEDLVKFVSNGE